MLGPREERLKEGWPLGHGVPGSRHWKRLCTDPGVYRLTLRRAARAWRGEV